MEGYDEDIGGLTAMTILCSPAALVVVSLSVRVTTTRASLVAVAAGSVVVTTLSAS